MKDIIIPPLKDGERWIPRAEGVKEYSQPIDGVVRTWREYIPTTYDGQNSYPVVIVVHGGCNTRGYDFHVCDREIPWAYTAEKESIIAIFAQSLTPEHSWNLWNTYTEEDGMKNDIFYLDSLLDIVCKKYNVDESRIYLFGHSAGDVMATYYLMNSGARFAAAATICGASEPAEFCDPEGQILYGTERAKPVLLYHGSEDCMMPIGPFHLFEKGKTVDGMADLLKKSDGKITPEIRRRKLCNHELPNLMLWQTCNNAEPIPVLDAYQNYNIVFYPGKETTVQLFVQGGEHTPPMDLPKHIWQRFFSAYRLYNGKPTVAKAQCPWVFDVKFAAFASGADKAYIKNSIVSLQYPCIIKGNEAWLAVTDFQNVFSDYLVELIFQGKGIKIHKEDSILQMSSGVAGGVFNGDVVCVTAPVYKDNELWLPVGSILKKFDKINYTSNNDVLIAGKNVEQLSFDFAFYIRQLLGTEKPTDLAKVLKEQKYLRDNNPPMPNP